MNYNVGIIGCGLVGNKRAIALQKIDCFKLIAVADVFATRANELGGKCQVSHTSNWEDITQNKDINLVIVATTNNYLAEITIDALKNGKHVLVEKPAGRNPDEIKEIIEVYEQQKEKVKLKVGFNHRFHPSIIKAKELIKTENIGDVMFIRARYGHGARLNYDKEWRAFREIAGGGEMLDQGSHVIDLSRYFIDGEFDTAIGLAETMYWNQEVEDNCFSLLRNSKGQVAQLHVSITQWKNIFSMEIFCRTGQINLDGLGLSYGKETLTFYKMKPEMGIPDKFVYQWEDIDTSWEAEYVHFIECIETNKEPSGNIYDAYESMKIVYEIYRWSEEFLNSHKFNLNKKRVFTC